MSEMLAWHVARASGIVALLLLSMAVAWGLLFGTRLLQGRPSPKWLLDLHRFLGGCSVVFVAVHITALVADNYVHFDLADLLVPFASSWRPSAVAWGVVAVYLLVAVEATSLVMRRLPRPWWRFIHMGSYGLFWSAVIHGATAGADAAHPAYVGVVTAAVTAVGLLTGYRVVTLRRSRGRRARRVVTAPIVAD